MKEEKKMTNSEIREERVQVPDEMAIISIPEHGLSIEKEVSLIEKNIELFNRIKIISLKLTKESDWVFHNEAPYLMDRGAENIAIAFGIDISDVRLKMEWAEDDKGRYYTYVATGKAYSKKLGRYVEDIGVCSQRDKFFGMIGGKLKEIEEVDMANIRRKAVTNLYNRLIKRCVGLMNVTIDDLIAANLDIKKIPGIEYKREDQKSMPSEKGKEIRKELGDMLMMMANQDVKLASELLEKYSMFEANGKVRSAKSLKDMSEKWLFYTYSKVKKDFEKTFKEKEEGKEPREPGVEG